MPETFILTYFHTNNPKKVQYQLFFLFVCFFILQVLISHQFYTHQCIHVNPNRPIQHTIISTPLRFSPLGVHTFVLYISVSTSALQTCSSVPFFQVPPPVHLDSTLLPIVYFSYRRYNDPVTYLRCQLLLFSSPFALSPPATLASSLFLEHASLSVGPRFHQHKFSICIKDNQLAPPPFATCFPTSHFPYLWMSSSTIPFNCLHCQLHSSSQCCVNDNAHACH